MTVTERRCLSCNGMIQADHAFCQFCGVRQTEPAFEQSGSTVDTRRTLDPRVWTWGGIAVFVFVGFAIGWWQMIRYLMLSASAISAVLSAVMAFQYSQVANTIEKRKNLRRAIGAGAAALGLWLFSPSANLPTRAVATTLPPATTPQVANSPVPVQPTPPNPEVLRQQRISERTLAYWTRSRDIMAQAGTAIDKRKKPAEVSAAMRGHTNSLDALPTLDVDHDAVECVLLMNKFFIQIAETIDRNNSPNVLFETLFAAAAGDNPLAPVAGLQQSNASMFDRMKQLREHALRTRVTLTNRYGREFPAWPW